ncbi:unnamed protein product [Arabis nemorensis]|uniref:Uncharacterized protein n=1 Tax=Arabis nemorensis TaxID=586526 RepID=A0A565C063_9BRAS|nr:unnamed protein product [Arabis nemorensis]
MVEFLTHSGILTAKKLDDCEAKGSFFIELNFPVITTYKLVLKPLKGATKSTSTDQIMVVLSSWESVTDLQPRIDEIMKCPGKVMIVTAAAPQGSAYDFCSRLFAPKLGLNECTLFISTLLEPQDEQCDFLAYAVIPLSLSLKVHYDKEKQRVLLTGKAATVMKGSIII